MRKQVTVSQIPKEKPSRTVLEALADSGMLTAVYAEYLEFCAAGTSREGKEKSAGRIPNAAGFCRFASSSLNELERLKKSRPEHYAALCAMLEDEALNSAMPPSVLSVYLKQRLGYSGEKQTECGIADSGQLRLIFDHDAFKDGI